MFCPCADSRWHESPGCVTGFSLLWWTRSTWWQPQQISTKHLCHSPHHHNTSSVLFEIEPLNTEKKSPIFFSAYINSKAPGPFFGGCIQVSMLNRIIGLGIRSFLLDGWFFHEPNLPQVRFIDLGSAFSFEAPESLSVATPEYMPHEARTRLWLFFGTEKPKKIPRMGTWQSWQGRSEERR